MPPGPECSEKPGKTVLKLDVPYIHQVLDVTGADGNWACGPVSVAMVLAYYGKLEPWSDYLADQAASATAATPLTASPTAARLRPEMELSEVALNFAPYVTSVYTADGHLFNTLAPGPNGERIAGLYGTICPTGLADWSRMRSVFAWNDLKVQQTTASWEGVVAALKRGHPVLIGNDLTAVGHVLVAVGYTDKQQLIVNDPYGNRMAPGYGSTNGNEVIYPWACTRARVALEVTGTYPPPVRPTRTPTATATGIPATATATSPADDPSLILEAPSSAGASHRVGGGKIAAGVRVSPTATLHVAAWLNNSTGYWIDAPDKPQAQTAPRPAQAAALNIYDPASWLLFSFAAAVACLAASRRIRRRSGGADAPGAAIAPEQIPVTQEPQA